MTENSKSIDNIHQNTGLTTVHRDNEDDVIDLTEIFYLLWSHLWKIILCTILGAVAVFSYTYFLVTPMYSATAKIYIVSASNDSVVNLSDLQIGASLTKDYQELLLSRPLLQDVISNLNLDVKYQDLAEMIEISNTADTRILQIGVTSPSPQQAADIANELVDQASVYLPSIMETDTPNLVESAIVPLVKSSPSYTRNTLFGALGGAFLSCAFYVIRYLMNDTFTTPDDIEKYFGVQPLATIPETNLKSMEKAMVKTKNNRKKDQHKSKGEIA